MSDERYTKADREFAEKLTLMFEDMGWDTISLTHISNLNLRMEISPHYYGGGKPSNISDIEYFGVEAWNGSKNLQLYGSEDIVEVAHMYNNLPVFAKEHDDDENSLHKFYNDKVAGYTEEQWQLSHRVSHLVYEGWGKARDNGENLNYDDYVNKYMPDIAVKMHLPLEVANDALELSHNASMYSDWSKDVYGRRMRDMGKSEIERSDRYFGGIPVSQYDDAFTKEHPEVKKISREKIDNQIDAEMNREIVRNVPSVGVSFEDVGDSSLVLVSVPTFGSGNRYYISDYTTAEPTDSYIVLQKDLVVQNEDGSYNLLLDRRERYDVEGDTSGGAFVSAGEIHNRMCLYREYIEEKEKATRLSLPKKQTEGGNSGLDIDVSSGFELDREWGE